MSKTAYHISLKGYVGGYDFDRSTVDRELAKNEGKRVNVLIDSLGGSLATGLSISAAFKNHGNVNVHFVGLNASAATIASLGAAHISIDAGAMYLVHKCSMAFFEWGSLNSDQFATLIADCEKIKADLDKLDLNVAQIYAKKCRKPTADLLALMKVGGWCIVTSPSSTKSLCSAKNRRHKERNFASLISVRLASLLGIPFYEDIAECHSSSRSAWLAKNHRVGAVFTFGKEPPT